MSEQKRLIKRTLTYDPAEMAARGRLGARATHERHDPIELTANARKAFDAKFADPQERSQHFSQMAKQQQRAGGVFLTRDEAAALAGVFDIIRKVAERVAKNGGE